MAKHVIDVDEEMLRAARAELGTTTIKGTVNDALRRATSQRERRIADVLDVLASARVDDRADASLVTGQHCARTVPRRLDHLMARLPRRRA